MISAYQKALKIRKSSEYKDWRKKILERDNYSCVNCGSREMLEIDHIKPLALFPSLALDLNNGRVLCHSCHKKTDTYGSLSKFKGDEAIHPLLAGDLLYKIESLPSTIKISEKDIGLSISFDTSIKKWVSGYKVKKLKLMAKGNTLEESIDNIFEILKRSPSQKYEKSIYLLEEKYMQQKSTKILRDEMYLFIESLLKRKLKPQEKQEISIIFRRGIKKYFEESYLN